MKKSTKRYQPELEEGKFYHIYNRGNNSEKIFFNEGNYEFFLRRYLEYLPNIVDTYAYCLLPNHFHMLIWVKERDEIKHVPTPPSPADALHPGDAKKDIPALPASSPADALHLGDAKRLPTRHAPSPNATHAFHRLFTSYSKAINEQQNRHGSLIENPFKRIEIDSEEYLRNLVLYIHTNPQLHGFVKDFRGYKWSSYNEILNGNLTTIQSAKVLEWFGNKENYRFCHNEKIDLENLKGFSFD